MADENKPTLSVLWEMRHLTVGESIEKIAQNNELKFLLTAAGAWFLARWTFGVWIAVHSIYFVIRFFNLLLL